MRYRKLDQNGDYQFGHGSADFLINTPSAVAQAVMTRLLLWEGEWFLDTTEGTPWAQEIVGVGTRSIYDFAIQERVLGTQGVTGIVDYTSDLTARRLSVSMTIDTLYGSTQVTV